MAVNLSARQLPLPDLAETVQSILRETGMDPSTLCLEITESELVGDVHSATTLLALKGLGVRIAIDDFGTGYSSFSYLKRFPVDLVKINRSFVEDLGRRADDAAIVAAMINLAHTLGFTAVAEGVGTLAQLELLEDLGCDFGQGFLWSRPRPPGELEELLDGSVALDALGRVDARTSTGQRAPS